ALAAQTHGQPSVTLLLEQLVRAAVPDLDGARTVLPGRNRSFEGRVVERMILDVDCEHTLAPRERDALRHGPAREGSVALEPQVVMEAARVVPRHDEQGLPAATATGKRLARPRRITLATVLLQKHDGIISAATASRHVHVTREIPAHMMFRGRG